MPLDYMTNTFVDVKQDLISVLKNPNSGVNESNISQYLNSIGIDPEEFSRELEEERQHTLKFNKLLETGYDRPSPKTIVGKALRKVDKLFGLDTGELSQADKYYQAPGYLQPKYESFTDKYLSKPIISGVRSAVTGVVQLGDMVLPKTATDFIEHSAKKVDKFISKVPYLGKGYRTTKEVLNPVTSEGQEIAGDILSLVTGTGLITRGLATTLPKLPGFAKRIGGFTGAEILLGDKESNIANTLIALRPETFEPLKRLAINPDDSDAIKILKKGIDAAFGAAAFETVFGGVKGLIRLSKAMVRTVKKGKFVDDSKGIPPENPKVTDTKITETSDGDFIFKTIVSQPVKILSDPNKGKTGSWLNRWMGSRQGMDKWTFRVYEHKEASLKAVTDIAKTYSREFERTVKKVFGMKYNNLPPETIALIKQALGHRLPIEKNASEQILKILNKSPKNRTKKEIKLLTEHYNKNIQLAKNSQTEALNLLPKEIREPILKLRTIADDVSKEIQALGLGKNINATIDKNMGIYLTEDFEAFVNPTYVKKLIKVLDGKKTSGEVFEIVSAARAALQKAMPKAKPDEINGMLKEYVNKLNVNDIDFLDVLKLGGSSAGSSSSANVLKSRKLIDEAYKIILNPIKDPLRQWNESIKKMSDIVVEHNFLTNIKNIAKDSYGVNIYKVAKTPTTKRGEDFSERLSDLAKGYIQQLGPKVNPLANVFTSPAYKKVLQRGIDLPNASDNKLLGTWYGISGYASASKTSLSAGTHVRNMESNLMVLAANGNLGPLILKEVPKSLYTLTKNNPEAIKIIQELVSRGVLKSGVRAQQIIRSMNDAFKGSQGWLKKGYDKSMGIAGDVYSAEDDIFKIIGYYRELARYRKVFTPNLKSGAMNENQLRTYAAEVVKDTMPTYNFIPRSVKYLRRLPIGTFPAFTSEIIRNTVNIARRGAIDSYRGWTTGNRNLAVAGAQRLGGLTATAVATQQYLQFKAQRYLISPTDQEILEDTSAWWAQNDIREYTDFIEVNPKTGNIEVKYRELSYSIPQAPIVQVVDKLIPFMMASEYKDERDFIRDLDKLLSAFLKTASPMINESLLVRPLLDITVRGGKTKDGRSIYAPHDSWGVKAKKAMLHVMKDLLPGTIQKGLTFQDIIKSENINKEGGVTTFGYPKRLDDEIKSLTGFKNTTMNISKSFSTKVGVGLNEIKDLNNSILNILRKRNIDWNNPEEKKAVIDDINKLVIYSFNKQVELARYLHNFKKLEYFEGKGLDRTKIKMSEEKMYSILAGRAAKEVDKSFFNLIAGDLFTGTFIPPDISSSMFKLNKENKVPTNILQEINESLTQLEGLPLLKITKKEE
jgi:hypothetical protein